MVYYSPNYSFDTGHATYVEVNAAVPVRDKMTVSGAVGYQDYDQSKFCAPLVSGGCLNGYTTWNVGMTYQVTEHLSADIRYVGTSNSAKDYFGEFKNIPFNAADRIVGTVKATF